MAHGNEVKICQGCFKRILTTLRNLTDDAEDVVAKWEGNRLADAVNALDGDAATARELLNEIKAAYPPEYSE